MTTLVKIGWKGELSEKERETLNDIMNLMGMQAAADAGLYPQEDVDKETARLEAKYNTDIGS